MERLVIDTNVLISRLLAPASVPGRAVRKAVDEGRILTSEAALGELADVLSRSRFDPYLSVTERQDFLRLFARITERVSIVQPVRVCRDPRDDKFLELALNGEASTIITGDEDLLVLDPFGQTRIIKPAAYLAIS